MAHNLWFKQEYIAPILAGTKTHTYRKPTKINRERSGLCFVSMGPITPFGVIDITGVEVIDIASLGRADRIVTKRLYPVEQRVARLSFTLVAHFDVPEVRHILEAVLQAPNGERVLMPRDDAARLLTTIRPAPHAREVPVR